MFGNTSKDEAAHAVKDSRRKTSIAKNFNHSSLCYILKSRLAEVYSTYVSVPQKT